VKEKERERERRNVQSLILVGLLVSTFFLGEDAYVGAAVVAIPSIAYIQWARWKDGARPW
jgi:hypothetical protein